MSRKLASLLLVLSLALCLIFVTAAPAEPASVRVGALKGPTAMGMVEMMQNKADAYDFTLAAAPDEIVPLLAKGDLDIKTSNGSISVENVQAARVALKSSNGGISGVLPGHQADWAIDSGTSNGHNSLPKSQPGQRPLSVHTSNGSISLRFQET